MQSIAGKDNASDVLINDALHLLGGMHPTSVATRAEEPSLQAMRDTLARRRLETTKDIRYPESSLRELYRILIQPVEGLIQSNKLLVMPEFLLPRLSGATFIDNTGIKILLPEIQHSIEHFT